MAQTVEPASPRKVAIATLAALLVAALLLFTVVLPAEYGIDMLGVGAALGLLGLAQEQPVALQEDEYRLDEAVLRVGPGGWLEYTYRMDVGATMLFSWQATGPLEYNFHSAPDGAPPGYAESFDAQENDRAHGTYTAPFTGVHGWYWENMTDAEVTISFWTAGFYSEAHEARDRADGYHALKDLRGNEIRDR
ncbi:MAG: hypothetical protein F4Y57_08240 [Acidobacteria bacterium]|nr:hypothetical protein [Acidobacteriota bacterium]